MKNKIIFLTYIPSPYRVDFFNELSKFENLYVVYYQKGIGNLGWKETSKKHNYKHTFLFAKNKFKGFMKLVKILFINRNETIIIGGYAMLPEIIAILFLKIFGVRFIINSDGGFISQGYLKTRVKKKLIQSASYWLSSGINTTKTLKYYGAKAAYIYEYPFSSLSKIDIQTNKLSINEKNTLKNTIDLKLENYYIVFVGQLIYRKGLDVLINAMLNVKTSNLEVLIIGDGELLIDLKQLVKDNKLQKKIHFLGKKSKDEVLLYLKSSDLFVLPSREDIWGLALNEAIANGLPVISTKQVGASFSLIEENLNGFIIDSDKTNDLSLCIDRVFNMDMNQMQKKSIEIAKEFTIENMVISHLKLFNKFN